MAPKRNNRKPCLEVRSRVDEAWYDGDVAKEGSRLRVHFNFFGDGEDEFWEEKWLNSTSRVKEIMRLRSKQLQDSECQKVSAGMIVCANFKTQDGSESKYYDARVLAVHRNEHSFHKQRGKRELCNCRFILAWEAGPFKHQKVALGCAEISIINTEDVGRHPVAELVLRGACSHSEELTAVRIEDPEHILVTTNHYVGTNDLSSKETKGLPFDATAKLKNFDVFQEFLGNEADKLKDLLAEYSP